MKTIKFSHDWNNKLGCDVFTTIRRSTVNKMGYYYDCLGSEFSVELNGLEKSKAILYDMIIIKFKEIPDYTLCLDTGLEIVQAKEVFRKFGIRDDTECLILLFKKV